MAYPISSQVLSLFLQHARQLVSISFLGVEESVSITESDIAAGGLTIDRYCASGNKVEIGSAVAAELNLTLNNFDGKFNDVNFQGAELFVQVGTADFTSGDPDPARYYIPMGYFTVDNAPRPLSTITITALDRMVQFDKIYENEIVFPVSLSELLLHICNICNVELSAETPADGLTNANLSVAGFSSDSDGITYRQILQWIAELTGTCAYIDWDGDLRLEWNNPNAAEINLSDRYSSDLSESDITITGVGFTVGDNDTRVFGSSSYALNIEANQLLPNDLETVGNNLFQKLVGFSYRPFEAKTVPFIHLYPMDRVVFKDKLGENHSSMLTHVTFSIGKSLSVKSVGKSEVEEGYAKQNPLTKQETVIIDAVKNVINDKLNDRNQAVLSLNETIAGALGLYTTAVTQQDGSAKFYYHSNPVLTDSKSGDVIYTMNAGGFAYCTTGWNAGNPVWMYGITKDGNAIFRNISTNGIEVSTGNTEFTARITPEAFEIWYRAIKIISANGEESMFTKVKVNKQIEVGKIRLIPHITDGATIGTDLVFVD